MYKKKLMQFKMSYISMCERYWLKYFLPIHTTTIFLLCVILHYTITDDSKNEMVLYLPISKTNSVWTDFFTCQLLHIDGYHLWNNMAIIVLLGGILELLHGPIPSIAVFWIGGTTGMMLESAWWEGPYTRLLGASSGAFALVCAYLSHLVINWKETPFRTWWFLSFIICTILTICFYIFTESVKYSIAHLAHIGGAIQGILVGCLVVRNVKVISWENGLKIICFLIANGFIASVWYRIVLIQT